MTNTGGSTSTMRTHVKNYLSNKVHLKVLNSFTQCYTDKEFEKSENVLGNVSNYSNETLSPQKTVSSYFKPSLN